MNKTLIIAMLAAGFCISCGGSTTSSKRPIEAIGKSDGVSYTGPECPVDAGDATAIEDAIRQATSCWAASGIAQSCAWGSSIDVFFAAAASETCAERFDAMTETDVELYQYLTESCGQKYADEVGTLYRSATAFCLLSVDELFNIFYPEDAREPAADAPAYAPAACPVEQSLDAEAIELAIQQASSCWAAAGIAESCAFGSSIDVAFVAAAAETCSVTSMSDDDQKTFDDLLEKCHQQYADKEGTLYSSAAAFCSLSVVELFHSLLEEVL